MSVSVAHSFGIAPPAAAAARMIDVPAGTVTSAPSIVSVTGCALGSRRPGSLRLIAIHPLLLEASAVAREIVREMLQRAHDRERRHAAQAAERAVLHRVAQVLEQGQVRRRAARRR